MYSSKHLHNQKQKYTVEYLIPTSTLCQRILQMRVGYSNWINQNMPEQVYWHMEALFTHRWFKILSKNNSNVLIEINKAKFEGKEIAKSQHLDTLSNSSCYWAVILGGKDEWQIFPLVMPRNRLLFLLRSLQLDNITTRHARRLLDRN